MKRWIEENDIKTYSVHNERKFIVAERFIERAAISKAYILKYHKCKEIIIHQSNLQDLMMESYYLWYISTNYGKDFLYYKKIRTT